MKKGISRRDFLKGAAAGALGVAAAGVLSACGQDTAGTTAAPETTVTPETTVPETSAQVPTTEAPQPEVSAPTSWRTAPAPIPEDQIKEVYICDIVIVGAGHAGMAAGMAAVQAGASTIIVEKLGATGSGRSWIGAIGTSYQKKAGVKVNKHEVIEELCKYASHKVDQRLIRLWADESGATIDWLGGIMADMGLEMRLETDTGNEDHGFYKTFPICHMLQSVPGTEGLCLMMEPVNCPAISNFLGAPYTQAGGQTMFNTKMEQLLQDDSGRVVGIVCTDADGDYIQVYGRKGVLLCTGGYAYNEEMMRDLNPYAANHCVALDAYPGGTGDGLRAATWIGAAKDEEATVMVFDRGGVPAGVPGGGLYAQPGVMTHIGSQPFLKVNCKGERFCNESVPYDFIYHAATKEPRDTYCMIFDADWVEQTKTFNTLACSRMHPSPTSGLTTLLSSAQFQQIFFDTVLGPACILVQADTLEELAEKLLLDPATFVATVNRYNDLCAKGEDEDFGKESYRMLPLTKAPYYGVTLGGQLLCTLDGLRINTNMQVLNNAGEVIPGLYAGGNDSGGFFCDNYPELIPGVAAGRSLTFGRLAAQHMAASEAVTINATEKRKEKTEIVGGDGNGTYSATKKGMGGDVTVTCTFKDGKLVDAQIVGDKETPGYGKDAIPVLLDRLKAAGTPEIDAVSGSSITSKAVVDAAKECFALAGVTY